MGHEKDSLFGVQNESFGKFLSSDSLGVLDSRTGSFTLFCGLWRL